MEEKKKKKKKKSFHANTGDTQKEKKRMQNEQRDKFSNQIQHCTGLRLCSHKPASDNCFYRKVFEMKNSNLN